MNENLDDALSLLNRMMNWTDDGRLTTINNYKKVNNNNQMGDFFYFYCILVRGKWILILILNFNFLCGECLLLLSPKRLKKSHNNERNHVFSNQRPKKHWTAWWWRFYRCVINNKLTINRTLLSYLMAKNWFN